MTTKFMFYIFSFLFFVYTGMGTSVVAATNFPSPMSLKFALSQAGIKEHPDIALGLSQLDQSKFQYDLLESEQNIHVGATGQLAAVIPSALLPEHFENKNTDHEFAIYASKTLYDFGKSEARYDASMSQIQASKSFIVEQKTKHYLDILQSYFNVLLADLNFAYSNEAMSIAYIQFDRGEENLKLKKISELEFFKLESNYQKFNVKRVEAENQQRISRSILAIALNKPDQLPSDLEVPDLSKINQFSIVRELEELKKLQQYAFADNTQLEKLNHEIKSQQKLIKSFHTEKYPVISGRLESTWYSRPLAGDDKARAMLMIDIPIYQGGETDARIQHASAKLVALQSKRTQYQRQIKQQVLVHWMKIKSLKQEYQQVISELNFRKLYLDKSRTEYEYELKSDIGDAMVLLSQVQMNEQRILYNMAIQWASLDIILGKKDLYAMNSGLQQQDIPNEK